MNEKRLNSIDILLVEDNEADIQITLLAFQKAKLQNKIHVARDGEEALNVVYGLNSDKNSAALRPDLILLDINLPKLDGFEVLKKLKEDPKYSSIPVIMLTSSKSDQDILNSFQSGACSYIPKPVSFAQFVEVVNGFNFYWNLISELPSKEIKSGSNN